MAVFSEALLACMFHFTLIDLNFYCHVAWEALAHIRLALRMPNEP